MTAASFLPTASLAALQFRARAMQAVRRFFDDRGYWEVDTPLLSADIVVDAWLDPFVAHWTPDPTQWSAACSERYLQTSPEFAMKRLLAAGATAIYQLGKVFRNGETGRRHNPEFTMVEWYRVGDDHHAQMRVVEALVRAIWDTGVGAGTPAAATLRDRLAGPAFAVVEYDTAFARVLGQPVLAAPIETLHEAARSRGLIPPPGLAVDDREGWLNWLLAELVEPELGRVHPEFLCDYPASQAALAKTRVRPDGIAVAERFELYIEGVELCNGYHELTDPAPLRERIVEQCALRAAAGHRPLPTESHLLEAMEHGLPESSGVALGFDRLVMQAWGTDCIDDVIPFPFARA
jgi:lysyl-tRNA synthetase class 2